MKGISVRRAVIAIVPVLGLLAACAGGPSGTAASFNETKISNASFERELNALKQNKKLAEVAEQGGYAVVIDGKINPQLAAQWLASGVEQIPVDLEFERRKLTITPEAREEAQRRAIQQLGSSSGGGQAVFDAFPKWFQDLLVGRQARVEAVVNAFVADDGFADDAAWAAGNQQALNEYCASGKVVRHILVKTREEAVAVRTQLASGADFAEVAKSSSTDPGSKDDGGALGCVQNGQFVAPFEAAMNATAPGAVSEPVQTEFGFHVIRVDTLDAASSPSAITGLRQAAAGRKFSEWLDQQMSTAQIFVDGKWGTASTQSGRFQISPPTTTTSVPSSPSGPSTPSSVPGIGTTPTTSR